ncbi:MAG: hypothetical protein A3A43_00340 [Candidatus Liptonbacteria bacterium RIFCSPLOWO2_01_FULL_56_20]|uniref:Uncharacterized protein n=1 Tax=Candidatus Liptonbacteria bacterium RIFCSPLOWO2_01_FULL_56_20 TaxID=1798652 RepID=A0A1G2CK27_9BACT|nr:MAG: hypothetical protein UY96_C0011G0038 [Parcubacteria group bacterium GW2011_GWB1_56_8]OGY98119.1 MAG: hypothetical protein A2681_02725 [Candidatus Liptonbacteria bacterium RIFCSPHIGHO2_01_FULL_56_18b]OGZ01080.1 MAG: hypothetical protein A3A43_00340 [Candidatus Liptonbacteria bacterium RIFCSPLOWO2_01_FULL_56_20]
MTKTRWMLIVLVLLIIGGGYYWYSRPRGSEISLEFTKPNQVLVGQPFTFTVAFSNYSDQVFDNARLSIILPDEVSFVGQSPDQRVAEQLIGDVGPGSLNQQSRDLIVLGGSQSIKRVEAKLSYRVSGSSAEFESRSGADIAIGQPAVGLTFTAPQNVPNGEDFDLTIQYQNNSAEDVRGLRLQLDYPQAFKLKKSSLAPVQGVTNAWDLGTLPKSVGGTITISGSAVGPEQSLMNFIATLSADFLGQDYTISKQAADVSIAISPLALTVTLNNSAGYVAHLSDTLTYTLRYRNNSDTTFTNVTISAVLTGELFNMAAIQSAAAFNSVSNTLTWNTANTPALANIAPGQEGSVDMTLKVKDAFPIRRLSDKNYTLKVQAQVESPTVIPGTAASKTFSLVNLETRVAGQIAVRALGFFRDAAAGILNAGPYPPKVNAPTQYSIHWVIQNYATDVSNVVVSAFLQSGTRFTGTVVSTIDAKPVYNAASGEVRWEIGNLAATKGVIGQPLEAVFQIENTPAVNQVGQTIPLLGETRIQANDMFVNAALVNSAPSVLSDVRDDPTITTSDRKVQP